MEAPATGPSPFREASGPRPRFRWPFPPLPQFPPRVSYNQGSVKSNRKRAALQGFWEKLLWVCIPCVLAATATLVSNPGTDPRFAIYSMAAIVAASGIMLSGRRAEKEKAEEEDELFKSALRALLRSELMRTHHQAVRDGHASTVDKEVMERTYQSYHRLGGNGTATNLHDEMMALPTMDD